MIPMPPRKQGKPVPAKVQVPSEGVRQDLEVYGVAVDPATGDRYEKDAETGQITVKRKR